MLYIIQYKLRNSDLWYDCDFLMGCDYIEATNVMLEYSLKSKDDNIQIWRIKEEKIKCL